MDLLLSEFLLLLGIALIVLLIGFYRTLYFISVGYGLTITVMAVIFPIRHMDNITWISGLQVLILFLWGFRLSWFLIRREVKAEYQKTRKAGHAYFSGVGRVGQLFIWPTVALLYVLLFLPSVFQLTAPIVNATWTSLIVQVIGLLIMGGGLLLEALADHQKSAFKARNPKRFCDTGLYRWVRCPNYLGEILIWVGNWVVGWVVYRSVWAWLVTTIAVILITLIMMGSAKRLEKDQGVRYGEMDEYQEYTRTVPILFPYVRLYTLQNVRVYLE